MLFPHYVSLHSFFQVCTRQWLWRICETPRRKKIVTVVVLYEEQNGTPKDLCSARTFREGLTDLDKFHRCIHVADMNRESGSSLISIHVSVLKNHRFPILYLYDIHCTLMDEVSEILGNVSTHGFWAGNHSSWQQLTINGTWHNWKIHPIVTERMQKARMKMKWRL